MHPRLLEAVRNNAVWCEAVCVTHGLPGRFGERAWTNPARTPMHYPDAISLTPDATAQDVLDGIDTSSGASVKDSFATLDLSAAGFTVLFEARWIHRRAGTPGEEWQVVTDPGVLPEGVFRPDLNADDTITLLRDTRGNSAALNTSDNVVGVSNVSGDNPWPGIVAMAARLHPGRDLVGYEDEAPDGFTVIGPLRVWFKD
ncbi:hypothetical protein [Acrocarpospora sp. B8E8]|uniref:hypothetical protein n=1 Tax=Acrocarpospora sp. B8E8 TaxID=3153572 RepID=UPI00325CE1E2